jgi:hypothetical protein
MMHRSTPTQVRFVYQRTRLWWCRRELPLAACDLNTHYNLNVEITALADLVVKAMRLPNAAAPDESISIKSHTGRRRETSLEFGSAEAMEGG